MSLYNCRSPDNIKLHQSIERENVEKECRINRRYEIVGCSTDLVPCWTTRRARLPATSIQPLENESGGNELLISILYITFSTTICSM